MIEEAKALAKDEMKLKDAMTARRKTVLAKKRLLLFGSLLERAGSPDVSLVDDITHGFDLTGKLPASNHFAPKFKPANIPPEALR